MFEEASPESIQRFLMLERLQNEIMHAKGEDEMRAVLHSYFLTHPELFTRPIEEFEDLIKYSRYLGAGSKRQKRMVVQKVLNLRSGIRQDIDTTLQRQVRRTIRGG